MTEGFSGADVSAVANTVVCFVLCEYLVKYFTAEEAAKHSPEALISMRHFEGAVRILVQRGMKPEEKIKLPFSIMFISLFHLSMKYVCTSKQSKPCLVELQKDI